MSSNASAVDPLARRAALRELAPQLEAIAADYANRSEPLRNAFNAMLDAGPNDWPEALYSAGSHLRELDLTDATWGYAEPPRATASSSALARYVLLRMARAATANNRTESDTERRKIASDAAVNAEANTLRRGFAAELLRKARNRDRNGTLESAREKLTKVGLDLTQQAADTLRQAGCVLTPLATAALQHWIDPDAAACWCSADGRLAPVGTRPSLPEPTPVSETEEGVRAPTRKRRMKRGRGRPKRDATLPDIAAENKLYTDWQATTLTQAEFLNERGRDVKEGLKILDRARKRLRN